MKARDVGEQCIYCNFKKQIDVYRAGEEPASVALSFCLPRSPCLVPAGVFPGLVALGRPMCHASEVVASTLKEKALFCLCFPHNF